MVMLNQKDTVLEKNKQRITRISRIKSLKLKSLLLRVKKVMAKPFWAKRFYY